MADENEQIHFKEWIEIVKCFSYYCINNIIEEFKNKAQLEDSNVSKFVLNKKTYFYNLQSKYEHIPYYSSEDNDFDIVRLFNNSMNLLTKDEQLLLNKNLSINNILNLNNDKNNNDDVYFFQLELSNKLSIDDYGLEGVIEKYTIIIKHNPDENLVDNKSTLIYKLKFVLKSIKSFLKLNCNNNIQIGYDTNEKEITHSLNPCIELFPAKDFISEKLDKEYVDKNKIFYYNNELSNSYNNLLKIEENNMSKKNEIKGYKKLKIYRYEDKFGVINVDYSYVYNESLKESVNFIKSKLNNTTKESISSIDNKKIEESFVIINNISNDQLNDNSKKPINLIENFYTDLNNENADNVNKRDRSGSECINFNINKNEQMNDKLFLDSKQNSEIFLTKKPSNKETPTPMGTDTYGGETLNSQIKESNIKAFKNIINISDYYNYYNDLISKKNDFTVEDYKLKLNILDKVHSKMKSNFIIYNEDNDNNENNDKFMCNYDTQFDMSEIRSNIRNCKDNNTNNLVENIFEKYQNLKQLLNAEKENNHILDFDNNINTNMKLKSNISFKKLTSLENFSENENLLVLKKTDSVNKKITFERISNKNDLLKVNALLQKAKDNKDLLSYIKLKFRKNIVL